MKNIKELTPQEYELEYLNHIEHINNLLGGIEHICVSTDNMSYYPIEPEYYQNANLYRHDEAAGNIKRILQKRGYSEDDTQKIMYKNFEEKILSRL